MSKKPYMIEEVVDKTFHHAALVASDNEWDSICDLSQITPHVFVGNYDVTKNIVALKKQNIKCIISVIDFKTPDRVADDYKRNGIIFIHYPVDNLIDAPISKYFENAYQLIMQCVNNKKNIIVSCAQGVSSAPTVVAYYILKKFYNQQRPANNILNKIIDSIKVKRACININSGFIEQLEDAEATLSGRPVNNKTSLSTRRNPQLLVEINRKLGFLK